MTPEQAKITQMYVSVPSTVIQAFLITAGNNHDLFEVLCLDYTHKNVKNEEDDDGMAECCVCGDRDNDDEMYHAHGEQMCRDCYTEDLAEDGRSMCAHCADDYHDDSDEWTMSENEYGEEIQLCQDCYKNWNPVTGKWERK